jgi:hypothetical protein
MIVLILVHQRVSFLQGIIWISLAAASEVPPAVSLAEFTLPSFLLISMLRLGIYFFKFEW